MTGPSEEQSLRTTVVEGGYCVGCGACAAVAGSPVAMALDGQGLFKPRPAPVESQDDALLDTPDDAPKLLRVCPFSSESTDEDTISAELFEGPDCTKNDLIGYHTDCFAGHVAVGDYRSRGSSGGMGSWLAATLLGQGAVDRVVHVAAAAVVQPGDTLFKYCVSSSEEEVRRGAKSKYFPVELSAVVQSIRDNEGRYLVVGVPCFIKALRLLCRYDDTLAARVPVTMGLVCGHLKSARFADMFGWQAGIAPGHLSGIDFRVKLPGRNANKYGVCVTSIEEPDREVMRPADTFFGFLWGHGLLKVPACDYCDDVFAETADITVGDAWLSQYVGDSHGTNLIISRRSDLSALLRQAALDGAVQLDELSGNDVAVSQDASIRHRRGGLSYRLHLKAEAGEWSPPKRTKPGRDAIDADYRAIQRSRLELTRESHVVFEEAVAEGSFEHFRSKMQPLIDAHTMLQLRGRRRLAFRLRKVLRK